MKSWVVGEKEGEGAGEMEGGRESERDGLSAEEDEPGAVKDRSRRQIAGVPLDGEEVEGLLGGGEESGKSNEEREDDPSMRDGQSVQRNVEGVEGAGHGGGSPGAGDVRHAAKASFQSTLEEQSGAREAGSGVVMGGKGEEEEGDANEGDEEEERLTADMLAALRESSSGSEGEGSEDEGSSRGSLEEATEAWMKWALVSGAMDEGATERMRRDLSERRRATGERGGVKQQQDTREERERESERQGEEDAAAAATESEGEDEIVTKMMREMERARKEGVRRQELGGEKAVQDKSQSLNEEVAREKEMEKAEGGLAERGWKRGEKKSVRRRKRRTRTRKRGWR